jgi:hypothetical protein
MCTRQSKMSARQPRPLSIGTILLVLVASAGIVSAALLGGFVPGLRYGLNTHAQSPTTTYSGYFSINYVGVYHYVYAIPVCRTAFPPCLASGEVLFFMNAKNGTIRLVFYCGSSLAPYYCESPSDLPFNDGTCLHVRGTLIEPSKWPSDQFSPTMNLDGELYVFENQTLPETSCS